MASTLAVVGHSGTGKSTAIEPLDPKDTFLIAAVRKDLPFRGWKKSYTTLNVKEKKGNYAQTSSYVDIDKILTHVDTDRPDITQVIIDDAQYLMGLEFVERALEKGYDKFSMMAKNVVDLIIRCSKLRSDLTIAFLFHSEDVSENMNPKTKIKTIGRMLDEKITVEGLFTVVLHTKLEWDGDAKRMKYYFQTHTDGITTSKTPRDMFEDDLIPNDLNLVISTMKTYFNT